MVGFLQWVDLTGVLFNAMIGAVILLVLIGFLKRAT